MINFSGGSLAPARALSAICAAIVLGCGGPPPAPGDRPVATHVEGRLWVLAPHPDDEVLMAGELLRSAVRSHRPISVLVMTNGDLSCDRNGHVRQAETIGALAELGVAEEDVRFLGYPDGYLDVLGPAPLDPIARAAPDGSCGVGDHTYASRGAGRRDVHTQETGAAGAYVASGPVDDLALLLARERPTDVVTAHPIDTHPDHAMTYVYLRRAIDQAAIDPPRILRALVHQGPCWPDGAGVEPCPDVRATFGTPFPALGPPLDAYAPTLRIASDDGGLGKRRAIAHYVTQLGAMTADESWLSSFGRTDEPYWTETLGPETNDGTIEMTSSFVDTHTLEIAPSLALVVDATGASLVHEGVTLRSMPIPHGEDPSATHRWQARDDRRRDHGPIAEITIRRDDDVWMIAVIAVQPRSGDGASLAH